MAALPFAAGLSIVKAPPAVKTHGHPPSLEELDSLELPDYGLAPKAKASNTPAMTSQTRLHSQHAPQSGSRTPGEVEASPPATPTTADATGIVPSFSFPKMNKWRVLAACLIYLGNGINDSAPGALIPYMESHYSIGYAVVSLIFVTNAAGFITAAFVNNAIAERFGRAKSLMLSEVFMIAGYTMIACTPPFPAVVMAYLLLGFGYALNLSLNNVFCANLANSTVILGAAHGSYGIGGILAPIIATTMVSRGILWSRFFIITIGLRAICFFFAGWAFWSYEKEGVTFFSNSLQEIASRQRSEAGEPTKLQLLGRTIRNRTTLIGALFIFAYQGAEVSESGWFISFLINYRNGDPAKVGYVTAGFWAGITLGRFILTHFAHRVGEVKFVYGLGVGVIIFQLLAWFVPNVIGDAGSAQVIAIGFISSAGSSGGAVVPFTTGLLAQASGTWVLHPVCIGFFVVMLASWALLPKVGKRHE